MRSLCNNLFVSLAVIFFMGFLTVAVGGLDLHHYITMLLVPIVFLIFGTIAIAIGFSMYLDELSPAAEIIGAVNTVIQKEGKLFGENTDGKGFVTALKNSGETLDKKNVTILGAGGAARAIAVECALNGAAHINIINRSIEKGEELASLIQMKTNSRAKYLNWKNNMEIPSDTDILINATSIGFSPNVTDKPDIDYTAITPEMCVCDVIFNPAETIFLKSAAENGAKTITGLGMLVQQAALNFTLWTGVEAPVDVMEDALKKEFE